MTKSSGNNRDRSTIDRRRLSGDRPVSELAAIRGEPSYVWRSGQERRLAMIARSADLRGDILDVGCGLGAYLDAFGRNWDGDPALAERATSLADSLRAVLDDGGS